MSWEFQFTFPGNLTSTFLETLHHRSSSTSLSRCKYAILLTLGWILLQHSHSGVELSANLKSICHRCCATSGRQHLNGSWPEQTTICPWVVSRVASRDHIAFLDLAHPFNHPAGYEGVVGGPATKILFDNMHLLISFRKSTPPQNCQLDVSISKSNESKP